MQRWLRRWGERSRPLESLPMLHDCAMVLDGEGCHDVNPLVDEPERLHSSARARVLLDERVQGLAVASDSMVGLVVRRARREESEMIAEVRGLGFPRVLLSVLGHVGTNGHCFSPQSDVAVGVGRNSELGVGANRAIGARVEIPPRAVKEFDRFASPRTAEGRATSLQTILTLMVAPHSHVIDSIYQSDLSPCADPQVEQRNKYVRWSPAATRPATTKK